ncbi:MAG TPA: metallopeptidase TldD-related protein [bacterium]|nr:metallopeptidase TldD-related protein [bacterium]
MLDRSPAGETEAVLITVRSGLTRFADSRIHQNVAEENAELLVRVAHEGRVAGVRTNTLAPAELDSIAARAVEIAGRILPDSDFPGLPGPSGAQPILADTVVAATAAATPQDRAEAVRTFIDASLGALGDAAAGVSAAGALATMALGRTVANSRGVRAHGVRSRADFVAVLQDGDGSSHLSAVETDLRLLDFAALGRDAAGRAAAARHPVDLDPGTYTVLLEPEAVGLMLAYLALGTFNGRAVLEGRSALSTRMGERIMAPSIQIWDDPADPRTVGLPFDYEGVPRGRLDLVRDGVAVGVAHDSRTARRAGVANTGRAMAQPNTVGPIPTNVIMAPGTITREEMIASTERGVLVSRFHYVRVVHPARTVITGMTRDGTFLIEGGRVTRALRNLRFNQSMLEAFAGTEAVSAEGRLLGGDFGIMRYAPAITVRAFTFTSGTSF